MKAAILGYGTIGSGVYEIITNKRDVLTKNAGEEIEVKYVLDLREFPGDPVEAVLIHDMNTILNDPEVELVIETMGGTGAAYQFVKAALLAGKNACTSNKALVAKYGNELFSIANEKSVNFQFEASVGGGIPIIRPLYSCITAGEVSEITGILNGTTNFMLSKMALEGREYGDVLKEAQALGFAERDPSADVEGHDACRKISILASIAFDKFLDFETVPTRGITDITKKDMDYAKDLGYSIKLLGSCKKVGEDLYASVTPTLVPEGHPLYSVNGVYNAIFVNSDVTDELMFYGSGAGKLPTASAVVADVVEITKNKGNVVYKGWDESPLKLSDPSSLKSKYFVRFETADKSVMEEAVKEFGAEEVSELKTLTGFALITESMTKAECENKAKALNASQIIPVK